MNKICFIIDSLRTGGKEKQFSLLLQGLIKNHYSDFKILTFNSETDFESLKNLKNRIDVILRKRKYDFKTFLNIYKYLKKNEIQIVHTWDFVSAFYVAILRIFLKFSHINGAIRSAPPYDLRYSTISKAKFRFIFHFSDKIIANSVAGLIAYKLKQNYKNIVILNGYLPRTVLKEESVFNDLFTVGMIANFTKFKDYDTFLAAGSQLLSKYENMEFQCIGNGPLFNKYASYKKNNKIKFVGYQKESNEFTKNLSVGVLLSNTRLHGEGISNSIMEYMENKKPVIATDFGGNRELVEDGKTGYLVQPGNIKELTDKIEYFYQNKSEAIRMGNEGYLKLQTEFGYEKMVQKYLSVYKSI